jgi:phosphoketolase
MIGFRKNGDIWFSLAGSQSLSSSVRAVEIVKMETSNPRPALRLINVKDGETIHRESPRSQNLSTEEHWAPDTVSRDFVNAIHPEHHACDSEYAI